jgi:hypothetical protein
MKKKMKLRRVVVLPELESATTAQKCWHPKGDGSWKSFRSSLQLKSVVGCVVQEEKKETEMARNSPQ